MNKQVIDNEITWHARNVADTWKPHRISRRELAKYRRTPDRRFNPKQLIFHEMGDLNGKRALDFGAGLGISAVEMAMLGATVDAFDLSPDLVRQSKKLARINGVTEKCNFFVCEATSLKLARRAYDIILVDNVLHHLPARQLRIVLCRLVRALRPGGKLLIREPVVLSDFKQMLKEMIPIHEDSTPDERTLTKKDIGMIMSLLNNARIYYYGFVARLAKFSEIERLRRMTMKLDRILLGAHSPLKALAGSVVIISEN